MTKAQCLLSHPKRRRSWCACVKCMFVLRSWHGMRCDPFDETEEQSITEQHPLSRPLTSSSPNCDVALPRVTDLRRDGISILNGGRRMVYRGDSHCSVARMHDLQPRLRIALFPILLTSSLNAYLYSFSPSLTSSFYSKLKDSVLSSKCCQESWTSMLLYFNLSYLLEQEVIRKRSPFEAIELHKGLEFLLAEEDSLICLWNTIFLFSSRLPALSNLQPEKTCLPLKILRTMFFFLSAVFFLLLF